MAFAKSYPLPKCMFSQHFMLWQGVPIHTSLSTGNKSAYYAKWGTRPDLTTTLCNLMESPLVLSSKDIRVIEFCCLTIFDQWPVSWWKSTKHASIYYTLCDFIGHLSVSPSNKNAGRCALFDWTTNGKTDGIMVSLHIYYNQTIVKQSTVLCHPLVGRLQSHT